MVLLCVTFLTAVTEFLAKATCEGFGDQQGGSAGGAHIQVGGVPQRSPLTSRMHTPNNSRGFTKKEGYSVSWF